MIPTELKEARESQIPLLERYRGPVDNWMRRLLEKTPGAPARMVEYHLGFRTADGHPVPGNKSHGKAIRPTLTLLTADATGKEWERALPAAASIELFHNFTLIHDDIQDGDRERHGKSTVWDMWGEAQAINAGDAAHLLSTQAILDLRKTGYSADTVLQAQQLMTNVGLQLAEGQALDMDFESRLDVTPVEYLKMIRGKTGVLIEASLEMGALLGHADEQTRKSLKTFGRESGLAFQIIDDSLGIWGDSTKTGKPVGADIVRRKKSYPIVQALTTAEGPAKTRLEEIYGSTGELTKIDVDDVMGILDSTGSRQKTTALALQSLETAVEAIHHTDIDPQFRKDYLGLAKKFAERQK